ncbi:MAG: TIGR02452 family protein, partial [Clostridia bacterium]|nr:TIGR02452 family protein [Clostridia bacterium]
KPNKNLYTDRALYTPDVIFNKDNKIVQADIITCASPNWTAARKWNVSQVENTLVLAQRIQFIKEIAENETVDVLILGAWGCGVFGQNPRTVARLFDFIFRETDIKNIIYAIPGGLNSDNFKAFDECIRKS